MITSQEFDSALKVIMEYKLQLENSALKSKTSKNYMNIEKVISDKTFTILQSYFKETYNENIERHSLKKMNLDKMRVIDFNKLREYRGFGKVSENKLKEAIHSVDINYIESGIV
jgi:hypothetical protein